MEKPLEILLVEDDSSDALLVRRALTKAFPARLSFHHSVLLSDALVHLGARPIDVTLLDLSLPDQQGLETLRAVLNIANKVPVIVLTGNDDEEVAIHAVKEGAADYLIKSEISSNFLKRSIRYAIERKRIEEALLRAHEDLEMRVEQRTVQLSNANHALHQEITERQRIELEREKLIHELREALAHVKTLSGLLPICAGCKKIRDDTGYWNQIEIYIKKHSTAEFTHSFCPDCLERLYPEYIGKITELTASNPPEDRKTGS